MATMQLECDECDTAFVVTGVEKWSKIGRIRGGCSCQKYAHGSSINLR